MNLSYTARGSECDISLDWVFCETSLIAWISSRHFAGTRVMGWLRISLTVDEQRVVQGERESHPSAGVRRRLLVLWSLHCGQTREQTARVAGLSVSSVQRIVGLYRNNGVTVC